MALTGMEAANVDNIVPLRNIGRLLSRRVNGGDIERVIDGFKLCRAQCELLDQILSNRIGNGHHVAPLVYALDFLLLHPAVKTAAMAKIRGRENAVQTEPDVAILQCPAAGDDAIGFVQIRQYQIEATMLFCLFNRAIKLARAAGEFR